MRKKIAHALKIKINKNLGRYQKCSVVYLTVDKHGVPLDQFMRMNLKDFVEHGDVEIIYAHSAIENSKKSNKETIKNKSKKDKT